MYVLMCEGVHSCAGVCGRVRACAGMCGRVLGIGGILPTFSLYRPHESMLSRGQKGKGVDKVASLNCYSSINVLT